MTNAKTSLHDTAVLEQLCCAVLRGETPAWPEHVERAVIDTFGTWARYHGIGPLLSWRREESGLSDSWPAAVWQSLGADMHSLAAWELAFRAELASVLQAFNDRGMRPLLLKGAALAYSHYPNPTLRPRGDTDLLVAVPDRARAESLLRELGYERYPGIEGELISYQSAWNRRDRLGARHALDLHWRINNSQLLARALAYDEMLAQATPVPALGPLAMTLSPVHALLFACIHRGGHVSSPYYVDGVQYFGGDRLIWLYDIHLLFSNLSIRETEAFAALAAERRLLGLCLEALECTRERLKTPVPGAILQTLRQAGKSEPSMRYLYGGRARRMIGDLIALENWSERVRWLRETAFPSAGYMRGKYAGATIRWLPLLYLRRVVDAAIGMLRTSNKSSGSGDQGRPW